MPYNLSELLSVAKTVPPKPGHPKVAREHPESDINEMMDADREWFEKHPFADRYYRKPYECEISAFSAMCNDPSTRVKKVAVLRTDVPGVRARIPIFEGKGVRSIVVADQDLIGR